MGWASLRLTILHLQRLHRWLIGRGMISIFLRCAGGCIHHGHQSRPIRNSLCLMTVLTSRAFQGPVRHRHAIIPEFRFVEFKTQGKQKQPLYVKAASGETLAVAAIWECWKNQVWSTAMITQAAGESFADEHDRMPLSLNTEQVAHWMCPGGMLKASCRNCVGSQQGLTGSRLIRE